MTGFGEAESDLDIGRLRAEVKSVNHRFFNANLRLLSGMDRHEAAVTERVKSAVRRGHVTVSLFLDRDSAHAGDLPELDLAKAERYVALLETMGAELDLEGGVDLPMLARFTDLFRATDTGRRTVDVAADDLHPLIDSALEGLVATRMAEGARLEAALRESLDQIEKLHAAVAARAPERMVEERDRLRTAVKELTEGSAFDEDRLAREVAYLAEKWDVDEELVRLGSHVELFRETLSTEVSEPVGKRLNFVLQEMNREVNTIASKGNDAEMQRLAVELKQEIERMREQVENVE